MRCVGSWFPDHGLHLPPAVEAQSLDHQESPKKFYFFNFFLYVVLDPSHWDLRNFLVIYLSKKEFKISILLESGI